MEKTYALTLWRNGKTTSKIVNDPDFDGDWPKRYFPKYRPHDGMATSANRLDGFASGIPYSYELSGPDGAYFYLYPTCDDSGEQIEKAKHELKQDHDVTGISVYRQG